MHTPFVSSLSYLCTLCGKRSQEASFETVLFGNTLKNRAIWRKGIRQDIVSMGAWLPYCRIV